MGVRGRIRKAGRLNNRVGELINYDFLKAYCFVQKLDLFFGLKKAKL